MPSLENTRLRLEIDAGGQTIRLTDRVRQCAWQCNLPQEINQAALSVQATDSAIHVQCTLPTGTLLYRWQLAADHLICTLTAAGQISRAPLIGRFHPLDAPAEALIPQYQGALLRGRNQEWSAQTHRGGHTGLSMGMLGLSSTRGSLLLVPDDLVGWLARWGDSRQGPWVAFDALPIETVGWRDTTARIYPCDPGVNAVCQQYRQIVQARGQWKSWDEKIAAKPSLNRLFGSLMAFIGYVQDDTTNYVANTRKLIEYGFPSVLAYPVRFAHYTPLTMAGGRPPIHLTDDQIAAMRQAGAMVSPWAWTFEGIDDGTPAMRSIFRHTATGPAGGWAMDGQKWFHVCPPYQSRHIRQRLKTDMAAMDWLHFDVNASIATGACWSTNHDLHPGAPLTPEETIAETRRLFSPDTIGDRIISSEGFNDAYTCSYDIGSTKMVPLDDPTPTAVPIPMTMLVYHDSCIHDWWELHNYNPNPCFHLGAGHTGTTALGRAGSGEPELKAAIDALNGLPPNVFPFGMQYGWVDRPLGDTYAFRMTQEDPATQEALRAALPVARLHRQIGKLAMTGFEFVHGNLLVQRTTFADGTQVTANLGRETLHVPGVGMMAGHSWHAAHASPKAS